ncbi:hypothetical protein JTE90_008935 [Oedothorax gibbosus]|uniref:5'-nucleotidase n=1 Tax=Oedothorax gibbosus TaxID=931172 RepID=A0AAV6UN88_9ARAC|nr:hypothetical protein JTE90_008935 [Oedothorax gibbosus]
MSSFLVWVVLVIVPCFSSVTGSFNLTVIHTNDVHAHFTEFNAFGGRCVDPKHCFGGFPRQVTKIKEIRSKDENVVFLNGGDFYQGTVWYTLHRWNIEADLVNTLGIDAMSLGNHEFDDGLKGLYPYLKKIKSKVVVCNIDSSKVPEFAELVHPSTILEIGDQRIGVIGYLTPETKFLSSTGDLEFEDEVECIKKEAHRLTTEEGLNKIFAVGHSGFAVDQKIAREVPEIDIVVGGHTNTFLYTGPPPSVEEAQGPYPVVVEREDGSKALVVQDFAFGKYMGYLQVMFDEDGRLQSWGGNPILLDASVEEDPAILELLEPYGQEVKLRVRQAVGRTNVLLRGDRLTCRMKECNLGNFLADASLDYFVEQPTEKGWNFVAVALWNSGGIRASIDERVNHGNVTFEDVITVAPFGNTMDVVALKGNILRQVLEFSMKDYDLDSIDPPGSFLQVSGLRLTYNVSNPVGSRLTKAYVRCADCRVPKYLPLDEESVYWVVMNTYMAKGGDGFEIIAKNAIANRNTDELDVDIIIKYLKKCSPVVTGLEGRIKVVSSRDTDTAVTTPGHESSEVVTAKVIAVGEGPVARNADVPSTQTTVEDHGKSASPLDNVMDSISSTSDIVSGGSPSAGDDTSGFSMGNIMDGLSSATERARAGLQSVGERVSSGIQGVGGQTSGLSMDGLKDGLSSVSERAKAGLQSVGERVSSGIQGVGGQTSGLSMDGLKDGLSSVSERAKAGLQSVGERVSSGLQGVGGQTSGLSMDGLMDGLSSGSEKVMTGLQSVGDRVSTGMQGVGEMVSAGVQGAGERLQAAGDKVKKFPIFRRVLE